MTTYEKTIVSSCHDLATGDEIDARRQTPGARAPSCTGDGSQKWSRTTGCSGSMDDLRGGRRPLDMSELEIVRVDSP